MNRTPPIDPSADLINSGSCIGLDLSPGNRAAYIISSSTSGTSRVDPNLPFPFSACKHRTAASYDSGFEAATIFLKLQDNICVFAKVFSGLVQPL
jgi:hypothetical protein